MKAPPPSVLPRKRFARRMFLAGLFLGTPVALLGDAFGIEPRWLKVTRLRLTDRTPTHRVVHFTDLHHKGETAWLQRVVRAINAQSPDFVLFTGDLVEDKRHAEGALHILQGVKAPMYGVPGNHDFWSRMSFGPVARTFASTGGLWMYDQNVGTRDGAFQIVGSTGNGPVRFQPKPGTRNILLVHYPAAVKTLGERRFDLILAGHSHGGQVRLPFIGPLALPYRVDEYDLGLFRTAWGPLYVGAGIGWYHLNVRFRCRPEITVFEL